MSLFLSVFLWTSPLFAQTRQWEPYQAETLYRWIERAEAEGIDFPTDLKLATYAARAQPNEEGEHDDMLFKSASVLSKAWHGKCCGQIRPRHWHIQNTWSAGTFRSGLEQALSRNMLDFFLRRQRPAHPHYDALASALSRAKDPSRRATLIANLSRWRWMPRALGRRYLLANIPAREVSLWDGGQIVDRRRIIVGKPATPTPVFAARVNGVVLNPWWNVPPSIAREGIAAMVRNNPAAARARGYVRVGDRYRQKPGDGNALGRMKLIMPNPYSVYLHDTSNRDLFKQDERLLSHGCVRVDGAIDFVELVLSLDGGEAEDVPAILESDETRRISLARPFPVYLAYFTAEPGFLGQITYHPDVYGRDPVAELQSGASSLGSSGSAALLKTCWQSQ